MKSVFTLIVLASLFAVQSIAKSAQTTPYWLDPNVNRLNVETLHASFFAYENKMLAQKKEKKSIKAFPDSRRTMEIQLGQRPRQSAEKFLYPGI